MGKCKYCGQDAGFLKRVHTTCEEEHNKAIATTQNAIANYFNGSNSIQDVLATLQHSSQHAFASEEDLLKIIQEKIELFTSQIQFPITKQHMQLVDGFLNSISISKQKINSNGCLDKLAAKIYKGVLVDYFAQNTPLAKIQTRKRAVEKLLPISTISQQAIEEQVLEIAATKYLSDGLFSDQEQRELEEFSNAFSIPLTQTGTHADSANIGKIGQAIVLKDLQRGVLPQNNATNVPVLLSANETILWSYSNVAMYNEKIEKEYIGRRSGFSFKVMKGVYYHTGQSKGRPIERRSMNFDGQGTLYITNKNLYFYSNTKSAKVPFKKIISIIPYSDGIEVQKDGNAKRQIFQGFDSWFIMNLLSIINDI